MNLLKDWVGEGLLGEMQRRDMEREIVCDLRRTNIFMRLLLFLFTLVVVGAGVGLFFSIFLSHPDTKTTGFFLLLFGLASYGASEIAASRARLYRYGIEEGLAVCAVALLCLGLLYTLKPSPAGSLVPAAGAAASLWIWRRFGFFYAFAAAMIFTAFVPEHWTGSHAARRLIAAGFYIAGLIAVTQLRPRRPFNFLRENHSLVEALLWLGTYLALNLHLSSLNLLSLIWLGVPPVNEFPKPFYWMTWVLIWALPPAILARGLHRKDRFVIAAGAIAAILTLVTNEPYLGWPRHTWDPMLLGSLLIAAALFVRRWLGGGVRHGFTAERLSGRDRQAMAAASAALGILAPRVVSANPHPSRADVRFGGGDSAGGGATGDF